MRERQPVSRENYLSLASKIVIFLGGPNVLRREVTEGILDRREELQETRLGRSVIKIAEQKAELIKKGVLTDATSYQFGEVHSIASMVIDLKRMSQESYEKTLTQIRNLAANSYKSTNKNRN